MEGVEDADPESALPEPSLPEASWPADEDVNEQENVRQTASGAVGDVGDAAGALHVYGAESDFAPLHVPPPAASRASAVRSLAIVPVSDGAAALLVLFLA